MFPSPSFAAETALGILSKDHESLYGFRARHAYLRLLNGLSQGGGVQE